MRAHTKTKMDKIKQKNRDKRNTETHTEEKVCEQESEKGLSKEEKCTVDTGQ